METLLVIWSNLYFQFVLKIILIVILAGIIGLERDSLNKPAGFKTYTLLGISAVLVVMCGETLAQKYAIDPFRIAAQFLSGIGFLGAGTILRDGFSVKGLTTASGVLAISCIGLCVGAGFYFGAIIATIFTYLILTYSYIFTEKLEHFEILELEINTKERISDFMHELERFAEEYEIEIKKIKDISEEDKEYNTISVVCKFSNKILTKNKLFTKLLSMEKLTSVNEA